MKAIISKYLGPTTFKGSRIVASDSDGNKVVVHYRSELNNDQNHEEAVKALCEKMNWHGRLVSGDLRNQKVWVWVQGDSPVLAIGLSVAIWYWKNELSRDLLMGYKWCQEKKCLPDPDKLEKTHVHLKDVSIVADNYMAIYETAFRIMQGSSCSPRGEAADLTANLIQAKGLSHTSMSVGDIMVLPTKEIIMVDTVGFVNLRSSQKR